MPSNHMHRIVQRRTKRILHHLSPFILFFCLLVSARAGQSGATDTAFVYKPDGTRHCNSAPGISLDSMAQELVGSGIVVLSQRKSYDGREGIALCDNPTGSINVYEIGESDLPKALELGFKRLDKASSGPR